jgi:hypothetical protein
MATTVSPALTPLSAPTSRDALNAECIRCMLAGLPFPEGIAPRPYVAPRPSSAREGVERILGITPGGQLQ